MGQKSFLSIALTKKKLKCEKFLDEMNKVIPWQDLLDKIKPFYIKHQTGRNKTNLLTLLKIHFLQQWYNLSDPGAEEAIYDRSSFQKFLDIDLLANNVPDESTILHFRHFLEKHNLQQSLLDVINSTLSNHGLMMQEGTIVDAVIIHAPSSTKNQSGKRDPEMSSTFKNNQYHFGMKAHVGVDSKSGLVHTVKTTTAKVHDGQKFKELLRGNEKAVFGDKAYCNKKDKREYRAKGIFYGINMRGGRYVKVSEGQRKRNNQLSSVRAKVEHPFRIIKCLWGHTKTRYKGLLKNSLQLIMMFGLANLYLVRKKLI